MTFAGLSRGQQRADVIDFLHTLSDSPLPLPAAASNRAGCRWRSARGKAGSAGPGAEEIDRGHRYVLKRPGMPGRFRLGGFRRGPENRHNRH